MSEAEDLLQERLVKAGNIAVPVILLAFAVKWSTSTDAGALHVVLLLAWSGAAWLATRRAWFKGIEATLVIIGIIGLGREFSFLLMPSVLGAGLYSPQPVRLISPSSLTLLLAAVGVLCVAVLVPPPEGPPWGVALPAASTYWIGRGLRATLLGRAKAERRADRESATNAFLTQSLSSAEELSAARERARIARELHDRLGHCLTAAHVHLQLAAREDDGLTPTAREALSNACQATKHGLMELRRCVDVMRDPASNKPLSQVIRDFLDTFPPVGFVVEFRVEGTERSLPPEREFVLFRTVQEGLTNAAKHARASHVKVQLIYDLTVSLTIKDDGVGSKAFERGHGLKGLAERVELIGGRLLVTSGTQDGFVLRVEIE